MDWITDNIAIGNFVDAADQRMREANGIRSMICLNNKQRGAVAGQLGLDALANYDFIDGAGNSPDLFQRAVLKVAEFSERHPRLLVQCHAGRSRSVIIVAGHLMRMNGWSPKQALDYVTSRRESAVAPELESLLRAPFLSECR